MNRTVSRLQLLAATSVLALVGHQGHAHEGLGGVTANAGRYPERVRFVARSAGCVVLFDGNGVDHVPIAAGHPTVRLTFLGANPDPELTAEDRLPGVVNAFRGADRAAWTTALPRFGDVRYAALYPGVDLVYHAAAGALKRDFLLAAGADPTAIAFRYAGARAVTVAADGALHVDTGAGLFTERAPLAWQDAADGSGDRELVAVEYALTPEPDGDTTVGFTLGAYDTARPLLIDPGLDFASYVGGEHYDEVNAVATDPDGNVYLAGSTSSIDFPIAGATWQVTLHTNTYPGEPEPYRSTDAFVMKLTPHGVLVWATFVGGKTDKFPTSLCLDDDPTNDPYNPCLDLVASPWGLGGVDIANDLAVDDLDDTVYVVGETNAFDFPAGPAGSNQTKLTGKDFDPADPSAYYTTDAFLVALDPDGALGTMATLFGGSRLDAARAVAVDKDGKVWVAGITGSPDLPITTGRLQPFFGGAHTGLADEAYDGFVARFDARTTFVLSRLELATYLGGYGYDELNGLAIARREGIVAVAGTTASSSLGGGSANGIQPTFGGGPSDGWVVLLGPNAEGQYGISTQTYLGGIGADELNDIDLYLGADGTLQRFVVAGATLSPALLSTPCTGNQRFDNCGSDGTCNVFALSGPHDDAFVAAVEHGYPQRCHYVRYLGGEAADEANAIDLDPYTGDAYVTGTTWSKDYPTIAALQPHKADGRSAGCLPDDPLSCVEANTDAFLSRVSVDGKELLMSTFLGGTGRGPETDDAGFDLVLGGKPGVDRRVYLGGQTYSGDFPTFSSPLLEPGVRDGVANGFIAQAPTEVADLRISAVVINPTAAERGDVVGMVVTVTNDGPEPVERPRLRVAPSQSISWASPPSSCAASAPANLLCQGPASLARGQSYDVNLIFGAPLVRTKLHLDLLASADRRDPNDANNKRRVTLPVGGYDLVIHAAATPEPVGFDKPITYTLFAENRGPEAATDVAVHLDFDPQVATFVAAGTTPGCSVGTPNNVVACFPVDSLAKGDATPAYTIVLRAPGEAKDVRASARVVAGGDPDDDHDKSNDTRALVTHVRPADVELTVARADPEPVGRQKPLTFTGTIKNLGPGDAKSPAIYYETHVDLVFEPAGSDARCKVVFEPGQHAECSLPPETPGGPSGGVLREGESLTFLATFTTPDAVKTYSTRVTGSSQEELEKGNNLKLVVTHVGHADLLVQSVAVADGATAPYGAGRPLEVVGLIANPTDDVDAMDVVVEYSASSNAVGAPAPPFTQPTVTAVTSTGTAGVCTTGPPIRCTIPKLEGGATAGITATMSVTTRPARKGTQTHTFRIVSSATPDPNPQNDAKSLETEIRGHDLAFASVTPPETLPLERGDDATWSVRVTNLGPGIAKTATFNLSFDPKYYQWVDLFTHSKGLGCPTTGTGLVQCALGEVAPGDQIDISWALRPIHTYDPGAAGIDKGAATLTLELVDVTGDEEDRANQRRILQERIDGADLAVTATGPSDRQIVDAPVDFTVVVTNLGVTPSQGAQLHVDYDVARLAPSAGPGVGLACTLVAPDKLRCPIGPIEPAAPGSTFFVSLKAIASGAPETTFRVTDGADGTEDLVPANDTAKAKVTIDGPDIRLAAAAQDVPNPVSVTRAVRYSFDVENPSTVEATKSFSAVFALDAAAAGKARIVGATMGGAPCALIPMNPLIASCISIAGLPKAASPTAPAKVTVTVDTVGLDRGSYTGKAILTLLSDPETDANPTNNLLTMFSTTRQGYDLKVSAEREDDQLMKPRGEDLVFHATVKNTGQTDAEAVFLRFRYLGGQLEHVSHSEPGGPCELLELPGVGHLRCPLGKLAYNETKTLDVTLKAVEGGDPALELFAEATGTSILLRENPADDTLKPVEHIVGANLVVTNVTWPSSALVSGAKVDLEVTLKNQTTPSFVPAVSRPVVLTHAGFAGASGQNPHMVYLASSIGQPTGGPSCVPGPTAVTCQLGAFQPDEEAKIYLRYEAHAPGTFTQTLTAAELPAGTKDEVPADNTASAITQVKGPDLVLAEVSADTPTGVGRGIAGLAYRVTNASTDTAANQVKLRYTFNQLSPGPADGFPALAGQAHAFCAVKPGNVVECDIGTLAPGESTTPISSLWDPKKVGEYRIVVRAESDALDALPADNTFTKTVQVKGPDLVVTGQPIVGTLARNETFSVIANVGNVGLGDSEQTTLLLHVDPAMSYVGSLITPAPPGGGDPCGLIALPGPKAAVRCDLGELPYQGQAREVALMLRAAKAGPVTFTIEGVTQPHDDENVLDQKATLQADIDGADLAVTSFTGPGTTTVDHDEELTFVVGVQNDGPADALQPRFVHHYDPKHMRFERFTGDGACATNAQLGDTTCTINGLAAPGGAGASTAQFGLTYRALLPVAGTTTDVKVEEPGQTDENPADNNASKTTTIRGADLGVTLVDGPDPAAVGQTITYAATLTNHGPAKAKSPASFFLVPREARFVSASPGCKLLTRTVACTHAGDLASGEQLNYTFQVAATTIAAAAHGRFNAIALESTETGPEPDQVDVYTRIVDGDGDGDGVSGQTEAGAPKGGDGNGDGIPDQTQPGVASVPNAKGDYVTVATSAGALADVTSHAPPAPTPAGVAFPLDAVSYHVTGLAPGQAVTVTITLSTGIPAWAWWKYGPEPGNATPHWYDFTFDGTTGAQAVTGSQTRLALTLVDGGRGDDDLVPNGVIVDPGAPALRRLVVTSAGDAPDAAPGDGVCASAGGSCTLRAAIAESNAHPAFHYVAFDVPTGGAPLPVAIGAPAGLPAITAPVVVDGASQPGWVDGAPPVVAVSAPPWAVTAGDSALRDLGLAGGVDVASAGGVLVTDAQVGGVTLTGVDRSLVRRSTLASFTLTGPATGNRIEGNDILGPVALTDASATRIHGNAIHDVTGSSAVTVSGLSAIGNILTDNLLGLPADGVCTAYGADPGTNTPGAGPCLNGSGGWGVHLTGGTSGNVIGGEGDNDGNVIVAHALGGVLIDGGAHHNVVAQNLFGTDLDGVAPRHPVSAIYPLDNGGPCVKIADADDNTVGGDTAEARNVCAGRGMAIVGAASEDNRVAGNWIQLDVRGDVPWVRLTLDDVLLVQDAIDTVIEGNVVPTIEIAGGATGTRIADNRIGTDPTGLRAFYADTSIPGQTRVWSRGVLVHDFASGTVIEDNLISGSYLDGIDHWESAAFTTIRGNWIGVDATGQAALPNWQAGILIDARCGGGVHDVLVEANVVAGNGPADRWQSDVDYPFPQIWAVEGARRITVDGNTVGLSVDGANALGGRSHGIWLNETPESAATDNRIGGVDGDAIRVDDGIGVNPCNTAFETSDGALVRGNLIGTDALGLLDLGVGGFGVRVHEPSGVQVGGAAPGEGNTIAHSRGGAAIWIEAGGSGNTVRGNALFDNAGLGVDLNGLGADSNVLFDGATNGDPEIPALTGATEAGGTITVTGTLGSAFSAAYTIDVYLDAAPDPSGRGEGRAWLGHGAAGPGTDQISVAVPRGAAVGGFVSATATDAAGNTSELSRFALVDGAPGWADVGVTLTNTVATSAPDWYARVTADGQGAATDIVLTLTTPSGSIPFPLGTLQPGEAHELSLGAVPTTPGVHAATASVTTSANDPNPANDSSVHSVVIGPADLAVDVLPAGPGAAGEPLELTATVTNVVGGGGATATPVLTFPLPAGAAYAGAAPDAGSCAEDAGTVTCTLGPLDADETTTVRVTVVPADAGTLTATMQVASDNPDLAPANDTDTVSVNVLPAAYDVVVSQALATAAPDIDEPFDFVVTVTNAGPSPAVDVVVTHTLQLQAYPATLTPSQGACVRDVMAETGAYAGTVRCSLGTLARGGTATITLGAVTDQSQTIAHVACAAAAGEDADPTSDCDTLVATVAPADLIPSLVASADPIDVGQPLTITATVDNAGPTAARDAEVVVGLPAAVALADTGAFVCSAAVDAATQRTLVTCPLGDIAAGAEVAVPIVVDAVAVAVAAAFSAEVDSANLDPQTFNDTAEIAVRIDPEGTSGACPPDRVVVLFSDTDETGGAGWGANLGDFCNASDCSDAAWVVATDAAHDGAASWHVPGIDGQAWVSHRMIDAVSLAGVTQPEVVLRHRWDFQAGVDGGQIYVSSYPVFTLRDPVYTLNPPAVATQTFGSQPAYSGQSPSWPAFDETRIDLSAYLLDDPIRLTFHARSDGSIGGPGWWVDSLEIRACQTGSTGGPTCPDGYARTELLRDATEEAGGPGWGAGADDYCYAGSSCLGAPFALATDAARTGAHSWFTPNLDGQAQTSLVQTVDVDLSGDGLDAPELVFFHRYDFEDGYDGGQVDVSVDQGQSWQQATFTAGGPTDYVQAFAGGLAFSVRNAAWPAFDEVHVDLSAYAGQQVRVRFVARTDSSGAALGWWIDDVTFHACTPAPVETDADLGVALSGPTTAEVNLDALTFTLIVTNDGPLAATDAAVNVAFPKDGLALTAPPPCEPAPGGLTCALGVLAAGASAEITLTGVALARGSHAVVAIVSADEPDPVAANDTAAVTISASGDVIVGAAVAVQAAPTTLALGEGAAIVYRITNAGPEDGDLTLHATLPSQLALASEPPAGCVVEGFGWACHLGVVAALGDPVEVTFDVVGVQPETGSLTAAVALTPAWDPRALDPESSDDAVVHEVTVTTPPPAADLAVSVNAAAPDALVPGDVIVYTVAVTNLGPDVATGVAVSLDPTGDAELGHAMTETPDASCAGALGPCTRGALFVGETLTITLEASPGSAGEVVLAAAAAATTNDPEAGNDGASATVVALAPLAGLGVLWVDPPAEARHGEPIALTARTGNAGPLAATGVTLEVELAGDGASLLLGAPPGCELGPRSARCALGELARGDLEALEFSARADTPGTAVTAVVRVTTASQDATSDDDESTAAVVVTQALADVGVAAELETPALVVVPGAVRVRYDVVNHAAEIARGVALSVALPEGARAASASASQGGCVATADAVHCALGELAASGTASVTVDFELAEPGVTALVATIGALTDDPADDNDVVVTSLTGQLDCDADPCGDGDPCTVDRCEPLDGCAYDPVPDAPPVACDDGDACTQGDACVSGVCLGGAPLDCADSDPCTLDLCDGAGCAHVLAPLRCDDANACTPLDVCDAAGSCVGVGAIDCDDGDPCTDDGCDAVTGCRHTIAAGCCALDADCLDASPCTIDSCDEATGDCLHVAIVDGAPCDADGSACTDGDACVAGVCVAGSARDCDDDDVCTQDGCAAETGCSHAAIEGCCRGAGDCPDDDDPCRAPSCVDGVCGHAPAGDGAPCDADGSVCTDGDACVAGACVAGSARDCDDDDPCTDDGCDAVTGCRHTIAVGCCASDADCLDASPCTIDSCNEATGDCLHVAIVDGAPCDADGSVCTDGDACVAGVCVAGSARDCDDDDVCTQDGCAAETGCSHTAIEGCCRGVGDCPDDDDPCRAPSCVDGVCGLAPAGDGAPCDADGDVCTDGDACVAGACVAGSARDCDDDDPCTDDGCDAVTGCRHTIAAGCCALDADCLDASPCTIDSCDEATGDCLHVAIVDGAPCDADGNVCTDGDACVAGVCVAGSARDCDDDDVCTQDGCAAETGCSHAEIEGCCRGAGDCPDDDDPCRAPSCVDGVCGHAPAGDGAPCDADGSVCTDGDACVAGACVAGSARDCDDDDPCTEDRCDRETGCEHVASSDELCVCAPREATAACHDGDVWWRDACGRNDARAIVCDDDDEATDDRCDAEVAACLHVPAGRDDCDVRCDGAWTAECVDGHVLWRDPCGLRAGIAAVCRSDDRCLGARCDAGLAACVIGAQEPAECAPDGGCDQVRTLACDGADLVWRDGCGARIGVAARCDDGDARTVDACDETLGACVSSPRPELMPSRVCVDPPADDPEPAPEWSESAPEVSEPDVAEPDAVEADVSDVEAERDVVEPDEVPDTVSAGDAGCGGCAGSGGGGALPVLVSLWAMWLRVGRSVGLRRGGAVRVRS